MCVELVVVCCRMADESGGSEHGKAEGAKRRRIMSTLGGTAFTITCGPAMFVTKEEIARVCGVRPEVVEICGDQVMFATKKVNRAA